MTDLILVLRRDLRPMFEMLIHWEGKLSQQAWLAEVIKVRKSITQSPGQYVSAKPGEQLLESALDLLFIEFLEERE